MCKQNHRHFLFCLRTDVRHSVQCLGKGPGSAVQQLSKHSDQSYIRYRYISVYSFFWMFLCALINNCALYLAPCLPTDVKVEVNCKSEGAALVSWNTTKGTANFSVAAIASGSLQTLCTTQENSCNVTGLSCGETYNINLTASNNQCTITAPTTTNFTTSELDVCYKCSVRSICLGFYPFKNWQSFFYPSLQVLVPLRL